MRTCEVLGTGDSGDEWGQVCGRESIGRCYDCAIPACGKHFGCLTFHVKEERITKMGPLGAQSKDVVVMMPGCGCREYNFCLIQEG